VGATDVRPCVERAAWDASAGGRAGCSAAPLLRASARRAAHTSTFSLHSLAFLRAQLRTPTRQATEGGQP